VTGRTRVLAVLALPWLLLLCDLSSSPLTAMTVLRTSLGLPSLLLVPGAFAVEVMATHRRQRPTVVESLAASLGIVVALGLLLNVTRIPLTRTSWSVSVVAVSTVLATVLLSRASPMPWSRRRIAGHSTALVALALVVFALAATTTVVIARRVESQSPVVALDVRRSSPTSAHLEVTTTTSSDKRYQLVVAMSDGVSTTYAVVASSRRPWHLDVTVAPGVSLTAVLQSGPDLSTPRTVRLNGLT
jgi:hypothetical protein